MSDQYIKLKDAAEMLGISPRTLRFQISLGKNSGRKKGHSWLISKYSLELYLSKMASFRCLYFLKEAGGLRKKYYKNLLIN